MVNLVQASRELFTRRPDERFSSVQALWAHCQARKERSSDHWFRPQQLEADSIANRLRLKLGDDGPFELNDWSFSQVCRLAGVSKDTINRLTPDTAARALRETLPQTDRPLQTVVLDETMRSVHGVTYTRLWDADLLMMVREFATDFQPPPLGFNGATGLYAGEQDMFVFLIDPTGWAEIDGEAFAPGFFLWNSEVGRRTVGISTFWFQAVCQNHIVWDATEVTEFTRKHTARVHESFSEVRRIIEGLAEKRDERRDGFIETIAKAMKTELGSDTDEIKKVLVRAGIGQALGKRAIEVAQNDGRFTIFSLVTALTRLTQELPNAGDRSEADSKVGQLLALAA